MEPSAWKAFINSLITALSVGICTLLLGGSLAFLVVYTDFPCKRLINACSLLAFIIPPYILGLSWILVAGRNGFLERFLRILSYSGNYNFPYYSVGAVIVVMTLHLYPLMYMSLRNALGQADPELEHAARLHGANRRRTILTVTMPLVLPAAMSTGLLVFSRTLANFTVPALLCLPVGKELLPTRIYSSLSGLDIQGAALLSVFLVTISTALYIGQNFLLPSGYGASGVRGSEERRVYRLGKGRWPVTLLVVLFLFITVALPILAMLASSFLKSWGLPFQREYMTLNNYRELLFHNSQTLGAFKNSIVYGITGSIFAALLGGGTVFLSHTGNKKIGRVLEGVASWPMAFPNIVLAVGAILAWNRRPLRLYGTHWVIIVTYTVLFTPIIMKQISGLIEHHDADLVRAARVSGAGPVRTFFTITLPAIAPGLKSGCLVCFLIALREVPISLMLYSSGQETVGILLFGMQSRSCGLEMTSTLALVVIALLVLGNVVITAGRRGRRNAEAPITRYQ